MKNVINTLTLSVFLCLQLSSQTPSFSWLQTAGSGPNDGGTDILADRNGNVFAGGFFNDTIDLNGAAPGGTMIAVDQTDIFFARFDSSGNLIWNIHLGTTGPEFLTSINIDSSGRVLITGTFQDPMDFDPGPASAVIAPTGFKNLFVACYDTAGNYQWAKRIGGNVVTESSDMAVDPSGEILLLGRFLGNCDFDPSALSMVLFGSCNSMFIGRYDANGNYINVIPFYDSLVGVAIDVTAQGDIYVAGSFTGDADVDPDTANTVLLSTDVFLSDAFFAKYTANGDYIWAKQIAGPGSEYATAMQCDAAGMLFLSGHFNDTVDFDPGAGTHFKASSGVDAFIAKYDSNGTLSWVNTMGWTGHDEIQSLDFTPDGDICAAGRFYINCDVDPSANVVNLTAPQYSLFVAAYSTASGDYVWSFAPENSNESGAGELSISATGGIYIAGHFRDAIDFDPDTGSALASTLPFSNDIFIVKYQMDQLSGVPEHTLPSTISYPNPTLEQLTIPLGRTQRTTNVSVYDPNGKLVSVTSYMNTDSIQLSLTGAAGTYMVVIATEGEPMRFVRVVKNQ